MGIMESPPPELDEKNFGARRKNMSGGSNKSTDSEGGTIALVKPEISYAKQELMAMSKSPLCKMAPSTWNEVTKDLPGVVRRADRAGPTSKIIQREMEGLRKQEEGRTCRTDLSESKTFIFSKSKLHINPYLDIPSQYPASTQKGNHSLKHTKK